MLMNNLKPLVNRTLSDQVADSLRELILSGKIAPGDQLVEADISEHFGISRNPVREALRKLERTGLVVGQAYKGFTVVELSRADIIGIYEVRVALENVAIDRIASNNDAVVLDRLTDSVNEIKIAAQEGDLWSIVDKELAFHDLMCELSGNRQLMETFRLISPRIRLVLAYDNSAYDDLMEIGREHDPLLEAIARGDAERAKALLYEHIMMGMESILSRIERKEEHEKEEM